MPHSRKLNVFKEKLDRIMTLRCIGIGCPLAKTFTYRGAKLYSSIAKDIRDTGNLNMYVIKPGFFLKDEKQTWNTGTQGFTQGSNETQHVL